MGPDSKVRLALNKAPTQSCQDLEFKKACGLFISRARLAIVSPRTSPRKPQRQNKFGRSERKIQIPKLCLGLMAKTIGDTQLRNLGL